MKHSDPVPNFAVVTEDARGTYADEFIGMVGRVCHADESAMILLAFENGKRCDIEERYLEPADPHREY